MAKKSLPTVIPPPAPTGGHVPTAALPGERLELSRGVTWSYQTRLAGGTCRVDGRTLTVCLKLETFTRRPPDVLKVEEWLAELLRTATTVEEIAVAASDRWSMAATAIGINQAHGEITARAVSNT